MTVGTLLVYYRRSTDYYYWKNTDKGGVSTFVTVLVYCWLIQNPNTGYQPTYGSHWQLALNWFITGVVLITITGKIPTKEVCQPWEHSWLSADCIQDTNSIYQPTWKSRWELTFYWLTNSTVLIIITGKMPTYYFHNLLIIYFCQFHSKCLFINHFIIIFYWVFHTFFSFFVKELYFSVQNMKF